MYFKIQEGSALQTDFINHMKSAQEATKAAKKVIGELTNGKDVKVARNPNFDSLVPYALEFAKDPGKAWRKMAGVKGDFYMPNIKEPEGMEIHKKLSGITKVGNYDYATKFNHDGILAPSRKPGGQMGLLLSPEVHVINSELILLKVSEVYHKQKKYEPAEGMVELLGSEFYFTLIKYGVLVYPEPIEDEFAETK